MIDWATGLMIIVVTMIAAFAVYELVKHDAKPSGITVQERLYGAGIGLVAFGARKKGIILSTMMIATIVFVVVVALVLFLMFAGIQANAGSTAGGFFYGAFDAIMKMISGSG